MIKNLINYLTIGLFLLFISSCSSQSSKQVQGYIEGRYTYMATSVSGTLKQLFVERGAQVKRGQSLFMLEEEPESDAYKAALDNLKQAIYARDAIAANLAYVKVTYERHKLLLPKKAISQSQLDSAQSTYRSTLAQLAEANANIATSTAKLAQTKWAVQQKAIYAPADGIVFDIYYRLGEYTEANKAIVSLLSPGDIKVIFYVSETDLGAVKLNNKISVKCHSCSKSYEGRISFISPSAEYTPPVIYSNQTSEKLIYRIEAKFASQDAYNLHPGQPVNVTLTLGKAVE